MSVNRQQNNDQAITLEGLELQSEDCLLCGSNQHCVVVRTGDELLQLAGNYSISRCRNCGHRFMNPRPTTATLHVCYPENYAPHQAQVLAKTDNANSAPRPWYLRFFPFGKVPGLRYVYNWLLDQKSQLLPDLSRVPKRDEAALLELGCSTGQYLQQARTAGWRVVGVELSKQAAAQAQLNGFDVHCGFLETARLPPASFHAAVLWMVLEHVIDPGITLRQLFDLLKPGGQLLLSVPNAGCWESRIFGSTWYAWEPPRHLHHFDPSGLSRILRRAGFSQIQIIHQRNCSNIIGSLGILFRRMGFRRLANCFLSYPDRPRTFIQLLLAPLAITLATLRQGGRLTVTAMRPVQETLS